MSHSASLRIKKPKRIYEVVILGGGFAGVYCARAIAKSLGSKLRHTAVAKTETVLIALEKDVLDRMVRGCGSFEKMLQQSAQTYMTREKIESITGSLPDSVRCKSAGDVMRAEVQSLRVTDTLMDALELVKLESHSTLPAFR